MSTVETAEAVRCSAWARAEGLDPVGTAGSYRSFLLVETPLPWPRDVSEIPLLAALGQEPGRRLQALVPADLGAPAAERRAILYSAPGGLDGTSADGGFDGYRRASVRQGDDLAAAVTALSTSGPSLVDGEARTDVLVCTHGRRDVCCGSRGTDLALQLAARERIEGVRFWRTSHTGGHRFAPTCIVLPQGTAWAYVTVELIDQILGRTVPFAAVAGHYRGCAGLDGPAVQALERQVLTLVGWDLLDKPRRGRATGETTADGGSVVRLEAAGDAWEAVVRPGRTLPVPDCMKPLSEARKTEHELVVSDLRSV